MNQFGYIEGQERVAADQRKIGQIYSVSILFFSAATAGIYAQQKHRTADELLGDFSLDSLRTAIQRFQEFAGLPKTGELDNRTKKKMKQPRCGMQDVEMMTSDGGGGGKWNFVQIKMATYLYLGLKWRKRQLTYRIDHFTADLPHYMQK